MPNANETSFVGHCEEAVTLLVAIEGNLIDLELIGELSGWRAKTSWLLVVV